jgi:hypothetical protein
VVSDGVVFGVGRGAVVLCVTGVGAGVDLPGGFGRRAGVVVTNVVSVSACLGLLDGSVRRTDVAVDVVVTDVVVFGRCRSGQGGVVFGVGRGTVVVFVTGVGVRVDLLGGFGWRAGVVSTC